MSILTEQLPNAGSICSLDSAGHCLTCSDAAIEVTVLDIDTTTAMALVALEEETIEIDVSLIDPTTCGDRLLVHGGVAIAKLPMSDQEDSEIHNP
jgi:hydrogenase maturation factor